MLKRSLWIASAVLLLAAAFGLYRFQQGRQKPLFKYDTVKVEKGRIVSKVTASGTLSPLVTVEVGSQVSGRIKEIKVDFNARVKKGQVLARIDPQLFQAALEQARANYLAAQGNLAKSVAQSREAERQYKRSQHLAAQKLISQSDLDTAQSNAEAAAAQVKVSQGNVAQAKAAMTQAQVNLGYTTIVSPIDGIVISRNVDVGQTVAASLQAPTLFMLAQDLRKMQVDTNVAEGDVGRLTPGMKATFTVDAYPTQPFSGTVNQIRNAPQTVQNIVTYDAVISLDNPELKLKPGMTANVSFIVADKADVLRLPNAALRFRPSPELVKYALGAIPGRTEPVQGNGGATPARRPGARAKEELPPDVRTIWVLRDERPQPVRIRIGITDGTTTEVTQGQLREGELAIVDATGGNSKPESSGRSGFRLF